MNHAEEIEFWRYYGYYTQLGTQRRGQAMMNALAQVAPGLYQMIAGTTVDCFYNDDKIVEFREALGI